MEGTIKIKNKIHGLLRNDKKETKICDKMSLEKWKNYILNYQKTKNLRTYVAVNLST